VILAFIVTLALAADEPAPAPNPGPPAAPAPAANPPPPTPPAPPSAADDDDVDATVTVWGDSRVAAARAALNQSLRDEGYRKGEHRDDRTIFRSYTPWEPRVIVHDDGWVYLKREPPRVHSPGWSFGDQGSKANYLWCIIAPTACVSVGGWMVSPKKLEAAKSDVLAATHDEVVALNDAVARHYLELRLNEEIPADLERVWAAPIPAGERRELLFQYWDSRVDDAQGDMARRAVEAFMRGVVMQSSDPYTPAEISDMDGRRTCARSFVLIGPPPE